jgi:hypothetical protein
MFLAVLVRPYFDSGVSNVSLCFLLLCFRANIRLKQRRTLGDHFRKAGAKFKARPGTYLLIPCVAALVGWFTNWLAVQMRDEIPLGLLGWQGIVGRLSDFRDFFPFSCRSFYVCFELVKSHWTIVIENT